MASRVDGLERWSARILQLPEEVQAQVTDALKKSSDEFVDRLKTNIPKASGELAGTIKATFGTGEGGTAADKALTVTISVGDAQHPYAPAVEFGHMDKGKHIPPEPFFFPLVKVTRSRYARRMRRAVNQAAKNVFGL